MTSLNWIRLDRDFINHPKVFQLAQALGCSEVEARGIVVTLWCETATHFPGGSLKTVLRPFFDRRIVVSPEVGQTLASRGQTLSDVLEVTGFLENNGDDTIVHDWAEKQGFIIAKVQKDRDRSRIAREKHKTEVLRLAKDGLKTVERYETRRDDIKETLVEPVVQPVSAAKPVTTKTLEEKLTDNEFLVFEHWRQTLGHPTAKPTAERKRAIAKALKNYPVAELQLAIDGVRQSAFHMGSNDSGKKYDSISLILRDADQIEGFVELAKRAAK